MDRLPLRLPLLLLEDLASYPCLQLRRPLAVVVAEEAAVVVEAVALERLRPSVENRLAYQYPVRGIQHLAALVWATIQRSASDAP